MERPPVSARFVPGRAAIGVIARFAFWPLAFIGARALHAGDARIVALALVLGSLVASSVTRARSRRVAGGGVVIASVMVGIASFAAARAALVQIGATAAFVLAIAGALVAAMSFMRSKAWRFAFAHLQNQLAVVSLARMDPSFPWAAPHGYAPKRPACAFDLHARAFKMITRQLVLHVCHAPPIADSHSVRRASVLGLADLDAIEEDNY